MYGDIVLFCVVCKKEIQKNNRITYRQFLKQTFCSLECKGIWQIDKLKGSNNPNFKHGLTTYLHILRGSPKYRRWRKEIFKRDDYTCVFCGLRGGNLNADHIKPFAAFPELRFDIGNGRTLCRECHKKTPTYGRKSWYLAT